MHPTLRLLSLAALGGFALSSCVSYDPYGYAVPPPVNSGVYYDTGYAAYPRYSGYDYGYGAGYGYGSGYGYGYPAYSSLSLGFFGSSGAYCDRPYYYSGSHHRHSRHHSHHSSHASSPSRTFRGAPLSASAPPTPSFGAPRQLPR